MDRFYRQQFNTGEYLAFQVEVEESDLFFVCDGPGNIREKALESIVRCRREIRSYIAAHPEFAVSLVPVTNDPTAPDIVQSMISASTLYGVGPMAAVAGAVAQFTGEVLAKDCSHLIIENGGDIYLKSWQPITLSVYAGDSPFTGNLRFRVNPEGKSMGICTSSGTVGHSLSFGRADAVVAIASTAHQADAAATSIGNRISGPEDIETVIEEEAERKLLAGLIIVVADRVGLWGEITLV